MLVEVMAMGDTRLTHGLACRARRRTPVSGQARPLARPLTSLALGVGGAVVLGMLAAPGASAAPRASAAPTAAPTPAPAGASCALGASGSAISHVIYIQFDNVHYTRDQPNVPSDLQQMPNLLNFITGNGTLVSDEHTPLIAHTADDIVTSETGLYGSDQGIPIANEYNYYTPGGGHRHGRVVRLLDRPDRRLQHRDQRPGRRSAPTR